MLSEETQVGGANGLLVMVVDDDPQVRQMVVRLLRGLPVRLRCASSAAEALAQLEVEVPDLLISDLQMPGMDGLALLEQVKARWPGVCLVLHTGEASAVPRAQQLGVAVVLKPDSKGPLLEEVAKAIGDARSA